MTLKEARESVGKPVMAIGRDSNKLVPCKTPHGHYKLIQVTKAGLCILEGLEHLRAIPSQLTIYEER